MDLIVQPLIAAHLVVEVSGKEAAYAPARPIDTITCEDMIAKLRIKNGRDLPTRDEPARAMVCAESIASGMPNSRLPKVLP